MQPMADAVDNDFLSDLANGLNFFFGLAVRGLFFLPRCAKSSIPKFTSLILATYNRIYIASYIFSARKPLFEELVHDRFHKPVQTAASTQNIAAAT